MRFAHRDPVPEGLRGAVIALGNFDGFHLGHQAVVREAVGWARSEGRPAIVRGVSRQADALLVQEVAEEAGYERTALVVEGDALTWTLQPRIRPNR